MSIYRLLIVALFLTSGMLQADNAKKPLDPLAVEVKLLDGKSVKGILTMEKLEVDTSYGKLQVPVTEIRRIDMGVRPTEELKKLIDEAVKKLGDEDFASRSAALKQLVDMGDVSYKRLVEECKNEDPEIVKLARTGVEQIRERYTEEKLASLKEDDTVITDRFTICGRVSTQSIKLKVEKGDQEVAVNQLRALRWTTRCAEMQIKLDAAKFARQTEWYDTKIDIHHGDEVDIKAEGEINLHNDGAMNFVCNPSGLEQYKVKLGRLGKDVILPGLLVGRIGKNGEVFEIGEAHKFTGKQEGRLYLQIGSPKLIIGQEGRSKGTFTVKIVGGREES